MSVLTLFLVSCQSPTYKYQKITLEVVSVKGTHPQSDALNFLADSIKSSFVAKEVTIRERSVTRVEPIILIAYPLWHRVNIDQFENLHRRHSSDDDNLSIFIAYLPGPYLHPIDCRPVAGLKYGKTSFALFRTNVSKAKEKLVLLHEFGHILGLIDVSKRGEDPVNSDRPNHCNDEGCVMFWQIKGADSFCQLCYDYLLEVKL